VLRIGNVYLGSEFFLLRSRAKKVQDPFSGSAAKIWIRNFLPEPDLDLYHCTTVPKISDSVSDSRVADPDSNLDRDRMDLYRYHTGINLRSWIQIPIRAVLRLQDAYPISKFFYPGSGWTDPDSK
jgi:hypothetical protein